MRRSRWPLAWFFFRRRRGESHTEIEQALAAQNLKVLAWRDVPTRPEILGEIALSTMPVIRHVLITADDLTHAETAS